MFKKFVIFWKKKNITFIFSKIKIKNAKLSNVFSFGSKIDIE